MLSGKRTLLEEFFRYCVPTVVSLWVFTLYTMVDGMFVARGVSELALSGVNIAIPYVAVLFSIAILFGVGSSTVCAIYAGQENKKRANEIFTQNTVLLSGIAVIVTAATFLGMDQIVSFLGATPETEGYVKEYLTGITPFCIGFILSYSLEILVKTDGHPRLATAAVTMGATLNCILDYVFVFIFKWGVMGAAVATGISQMLVMTIYIVHFLRRQGRMSFVRFKFDFSLYRRIIPIGLPDGFTELSAGLIVFIFNRVILHFIGVEAVVSYTIIAYMGNIVVMTMAGISQGIQPLVSYSLGAGDKKSCDKLLTYAYRTVFVISVISLAAAVLFAKQIVGIFITDHASELFSFSVAVLRIYSISFLVVGYNVVSIGFLTALEKPRSSIVISLSRSVAVPALSLLLLTSCFGGAGIWWAALMSEMLCLILSVAFIRRRQR